MFKEKINEIIEYGKLAGLKNLTPGISGNISQRIDDKIVITATATANGYLSAEDFSILDMNSVQIEGSKKPSSEKFLHIEFYKHRKDINAIFHVHSPYLTAFASAGIPMTEGVSPEIIYCFGQIPLAEYALPGSEELVNCTAKYFNNYDVILLKNHGVIVGGKTIKDAYLKLELCEAYAKTLICSKILGGAKILSEEKIKEIYSLRNK